MQVLTQQAAAFLDQAPGARAGEDPRAVHQMRVATRRLRAALRLFGDVLPPEAGAVRDELHWIAGQLGPVRDLDVQLERLRERALELGISVALVPYGAWLEAQRRQAQATLVAALGSQRFDALAQRLHGVHAWTPILADDRPLRTDAPRRVRRAYRQLRKLADALGPESPPAEFHRVRIRAKRLRYAAEFFEATYGKPAQQLVRRAVRLQDLLGDLQDGVVSAQRIHAAVQTAAGTWPAETSLALGQVVEHDRQRGEQIRRRFASVYRALNLKGWRRLRRVLDA